MEFDKQGYLYPYEIIEITLAMFESFFVENLPDSAHRKDLFVKYLSFVEELKASFPIPFFQWVGGSFITNKELPGDMDVITFLPYDLMSSNISAVHYFREASKFRFNIDAKFFPVCKWNHRLYQSAVEQETYWKNLYGFSRPDINEVRFPKAIIKLNFKP